MHCPDCWDQKLLSRGFPGMRKSISIVKRHQAGITLKWMVTPPFRSPSSQVVQSDWLQYIRSLIKKDDAQQMTPLSRILNHWKSLGAGLLAFTKREQMWIESWCCLNWQWCRDYFTTLLGVIKADIIITVAVKKWKLRIWAALLFS